jgi:hypothetical protein
MKHKKEKAAFDQTIKEFWILIWVLTGISLLSLGLAAYSLHSIPAHVQKYVSQNKSELKGDIGPVGPQGLQGPTGASGANASVPTACRNLNLIGPTPSYCQ